MAKRLIAVGRKYAPLHTVQLTFDTSEFSVSPKQAARASEAGLIPWRPAPQVSETDHDLIRKQRLEDNDGEA